MNPAYIDIAFELLVLFSHSLVLIFEISGHFFPQVKLRPQPHHVTAE
jgi:hypothetical protein